MLPASCALVSFSTLAPFLWKSALWASAFAAALATGLTALIGLGGCFADLAGAFLAGALLEAAALAAGFLRVLAGFLEWDALVTDGST